jgi:hypothetical protein
MKSNPVFKLLLIASLSALTLTVSAGSAAQPADAVDVLRSIYRADRQALLADALQLTDAEGKVFWPLYKSYRADVDKLGDDLVKLVLEYMDLYPNVSDADARRLLKHYMALEQKLLSKRSWYLKRAGQTLPADKVLRWAQLENRMDLGLRLQLAGMIPLVPAAKDAGDAKQ